MVREFPSLSPACNKIPFLWLAFATIATVIHPSFPLVGVCHQPTENQFFPLVGVCHQPTERSVEKNCDPDWSAYADCKFPKGRKTIS